jgi:mono/diheme cytochrome c family protein
MNKAKNLCLYLAIAAGLGFFLADISSSDTNKALAEERPDGAKLYAAHCAGCHPNGGNIINQALPVIGSSHMKTVDAFTKFNRQPLKADGSKGIMPAFTKEQISDRDIKMIYEYAKKLTPIKQ